MNHKYNVCIISTVTSTMNAFILPAAEYLQLKGLNVTLMCDMEDDFINRNAKKFKCINIKMKRDIDILGGIKAIYSMYRHFKENNFDMVQYCTPNASLYSAIASYIAKVPNRVYCQWGIRYVGFSGIKRSIFKLIEKLVCILSTDIRPASQKNMEFAIQEGLSKAYKYRLVGHGGTIGVDLNKYNKETKIKYREQIRKQLDIEDKVVFGYVGSIRTDKGSNELLQAFKKLDEKYDDIALILLGTIFEGDPIDKNLLTWSQKKKNIIYCGHVNNVNQYMSAMDILVHPSYREGFSMVSQEAGAMRLPVITTNIPGASEAIVDNETGILVEKGNEKELLIAMEDLKNDSKKCYKLGCSGENRVNTYFERNKMLENIYIDRINILRK